jgi:hypothetical protein
MIQFVTSPEEVKIKYPIKLFLAGDISGCPDWQNEIMERLFNDSEDKTHDYLCNVIVFNPRREHFPIHIKEESERQIVWEFNRLKEADIIAFWFSRGSLNPISLYELGKWGNSSNKSIIVGIDDEYERKFDVEVQTRLARPEVKIVYNLRDFYYNILTEIKKISKI